MHHTHTRVPFQSSPYLILSGIKFAVCIISSIKFASSVGKSWKGAWGSLPPRDTEPVARTRLVSVLDWRLSVRKNARVLVISPTLKLSAAGSPEFFAHLSLSSDWAQ